MPSRAPPPRAPPAPPRRAGLDEEAEEQSSPATWGGACAPPSLPAGWRIRVTTSLAAHPCHHVRARCAASRVDAGVDTAPPGLPIHGPGKLT